jgi:MFS family permease
MICIASSAALAHTLFLKPVAWWLLRAITGLCFAALFMIIESWLNERSTKDNRGTVFSIYAIISLTVLTVGQLMIMLYDPAAFPLFCIIAILFSLAAVPVALTTAQAPAPISNVKIRLRHIFNTSQVGFAGCLTAGLSNGAFWSFAPVFAKQIGLDISGIAFFMSIATIAGALGQGPFGFLSDKGDRRKVITIICMFASLSGMGVPAFSKLTGIGIFIFPFLFGFFAFPLYAICVAHTNDHIKPDDYVETASGLLLINAIGAVIGPSLVSIIMRLIGERGLFGYTAVVHAGMTVFTIHSMRVHAPPMDKDRGAFSEAILNAQTVAPLNLVKESQESKN